MDNGEEGRRDSQQREEIGEFQKLRHGISGSISDVYLADEMINVRTEETELLPEDEDFMRNFDRVVAEAMQVSKLNF